MSNLEKETLVKLLKEVVEKSDKLFETKEQSDAYVIGMLQGTLKGVINWLEK
jgi:hypothetical protein